MNEHASLTIRTAIKERLGIEPRVYGENDNLSFSYNGMSGLAKVVIRDFDSDADQARDPKGTRGSVGMIVVVAGTPNEDYPSRYFDQHLDAGAVVEFVVELYEATRERTAA